MLHLRIYACIKQEPVLITQIYGLHRIFSPGVLISSVIHGNRSISYVILIHGLSLFLSGLLVKSPYYYQYLTLTLRILLYVPIMGHEYITWYVIVIHVSWFNLSHAPKIVLINKIF